MADGLWTGIDGVLATIAETVEELCPGWGLAKTVEYGVNGRGTVTVGVAVRTPDQPFRFRRVRAVIVEPEKGRRSARDLAGSECGVLSRLLRGDGWPIRPSEEETRLRLSVMGPDGVLAILRKYAEEIERAEHPDPDRRAYDEAEFPHRCCMQFY